MRNDELRELTRPFISIPAIAELLRCYLANPRLSIDSFKSAVLDYLAEYEELEHAETN